MAGQQSFGASLANGFKLPAMRVQVDQPVMELVSDVPMPEPTSPLGFDGAFLVVWQIAGSQEQIWFGGQPEKSQGILSGKTSSYDTQPSPKVVGGPYHSLQFRLPRSAIKNFASGNEKQTADNHCERIGIVVRDPVVDELGRAVLHASVAPRKINSEFLDRILRALCARLAYACNKAGPATLQPVGLATWQQRRAKELLNNGDGANMSLRQLADECGLSVSHFIRAFRKSTGLPPRQWQLRLRIERAKNLMMQSEMPLSQVGLDCGFGDQSHFTRAFARAVGATPSAWRKANRSGSEAALSCVERCDSEQSSHSAPTMTVATPGPTRLRVGGGAGSAHIDRPEVTANDAATSVPTVLVGSPTKIPRHQIVEAALKRLPAALRTATLEALLDAVKLDPTDRTIVHCRRALERSLSGPAPPPQSFVDHLLEAVAAQLATRSLRRNPHTLTPRGGLAPWQERRVKALMTANLAMDLSLKRLASECDLSVTQFARAFR